MIEAIASSGEAGLSSFVGQELSKNERPELTSAKNEAINQCCRSALIKAALSGFTYGCSNNPSSNLARSTRDTAASITESALTGYAGMALQADGHAAKNSPHDEDGERARERVAKRSHGEQQCGDDQELLAAEFITQQTGNQRADFIGRAVPIVRGKCKQREFGDAEVGRGFSHPAHGFDAGTMTGEPWQPATGRPAAIAVHDYGDVKVGFRFSFP
jgi:hypothetical protein